MATRTFDQDPDLSVFLESDSENTYPCFAITDIFWSNEVDPDHDGYFLSKNLTYTISLAGNLTCSEYGFEKLIYALYHIDFWEDLILFDDRNIVFTPTHAAQTWTENIALGLHPLDFREYQFGIQADMAEWSQIFLLLDKIAIAIMPILIQHRCWLTINLKMRNKTRPKSFVPA